MNFIVKDMRPLAAVSGNGFKDIIHFFEPGYIIPSQRTLWKNITYQYEELRVQLATEMKDQSVCKTVQKPQMRRGVWSATFATLLWQQVL